MAALWGVMEAEPTFHGSLFRCQVALPGDRVSAMELTAFGPAAAFALAATITPGGATTLATASGARFGFLRSVPLLAGIACGLAAMAAVASAGLAGALAANPSLGLAMKAVGSAYLLWLAWRTAAAGAPKPKSAMERPLGAAAGAWLLWCNPKAWAMTEVVPISWTVCGLGSYASASTVCVLAS